MKIEMLDPQYEPQIEQYMAALQREITRAFMVPPALLHGPHYALLDFQRSAFARTEGLRNELGHLIATNARPRMLVTR